MTRFLALALACAASVGFAESAVADSLDRAGSLLVYPLFINSRDGLYTITVTNTNSDTTPAAGGQFLNGTVDVEFVYINGLDCQEFNRTRRLTPNDTITVTTLLDNPNQQAGYVYVFAKSPSTGKAIKFDWLAGDSFQLGPAFFGGADIPPVVFRAGTGLAAGAGTDVDNDGVRDLNGNEYEKVSDKLLVPRFIAQDTLNSDPALVLIGLTGRSFVTVIDFLIYNDNEEVFSAQHSFECWSVGSLQSINNAFSQTFLASTNHAVNEDYAGREYGWFRMDGAVAFSTAAAVQDPAFLAIRIERFVVSVRIGASLPYGIGEQANGDLVVHGPFPDAN